MGVLYIALGILYLVGKVGLLTHPFGPSLSRLQGVRGSVTGWQHCLGRCPRGRVRY
jgi:hypothetical protein